MQTFKLEFDFGNILYFYTPVRPRAADLMINDYCEVNHVPALNDNNRNWKNNKE